MTGLLGPGGEYVRHDEQQVMIGTFLHRLVGGSEYLFQAKDEEELNMWVAALQVATSAEGSAGPSRSQTLPAGSEKKDEPKRRSFFTLKKK